VPTHPRHHFGLICPPGVSHVTCLTTIARELCQRGHRATVFNILDVEPLARSEGVEFRALGIHAHPPGSFRQFSERFSSLHGIAAMRYGLQVAAAEISMLLEEAPEAMRTAGVTALLVDQGQPAGSTIAERLGMPFITVCNAAPADPDPAVPPTVTGWSGSSSLFGRLRNRAAYAALELALTPLRNRVNAYRDNWGLRRLRSLAESFSTVLELSQQTREFDFPRIARPANFHYIGLIRRTGSAPVEFPFERLDGRPMAYASLGTVATDEVGLFPALARACAALNVQLVITLGGRGERTQLNKLPGNPIVVEYAPQMALLERAAVTVCHAGNNTVLESLSCGVPALAVPLNTDQYSVAARLRHSGAGESVRLTELSEVRVAELLGRILGDASYVDRARVIRDSIARAGGTMRAADLIEQALTPSPRRMRVDSCEGSSHPSALRNGQRTP
jgi:zeaxanthin glucosyltransferase